MSNKLLSKYDKFCLTTKVDLEALSTLSNEQFQLKPDANKWNLSQLFDHLLGIEKMALMYMMKKSQASDLKTGGIKTWVYSFLLRQNLRSDKKFRIPSVLPQPAADRSIEDIQQEFQRTRAKMLDFVRGWDESKKNLLIFKHPRVGMLSLGQTIKFFGDHWFHHQTQLQELLSLSSKENSHV